MLSEIFSMLTQAYEFKGRRVAQAFVLTSSLMLCFPSLALAHHTCAQAVKAYNSYVDSLKEIRTLNAKASNPTTVNNPELVTSTLDSLSQARQYCTDSAYRYNEAYAELPSSTALHKALPSKAEMNYCMLDFPGIRTHIFPKFHGSCPEDLTPKESTHHDHHDH